MGIATWQAYHLMQLVFGLAAGDGTELATHSRRSWSDLSSIDMAHGAFGLRCCAAMSPRPIQEVNHPKTDAIPVADLLDIEGVVGGAAVPGCGVCIVAILIMPRCQRLSS